MGDTLAAPHAGRQSSELPSWRCWLRPGAQAQARLSPTPTAAAASPIGYWSPRKPEARALTLMGNVV